MTQEVLHGLDDSIVKAINLEPKSKVLTYNLAPNTFLQF